MFKRIVVGVDEHEGCRDVIVLASMLAAPDDEWLSVRRFDVGNPGPPARPLGDDRWRPEASLVGALRTARQAQREKSSRRWVRAKR